MALISKRFSTAKKIVGPSRRPAVAVDIAVSVRQGTRPAPAPTAAAGFQAEPSSTAAAVFKASIDGRRRRLKMMVDKAMSDSDENRKRSQAGKVIVKA
ncbi:hypothetical protein PQR75_42000 [Paraburkholderia fungorum]|uniref:hypothetical protein n=1 Tax=Paraburkholderia fungorum TaxID=134537 RepID=UPI0038B95B9E